MSKDNEYYYRKALRDRVRAHLGPSIALDLVEGFISCYDAREHDKANDIRQDAKDQGYKLAVSYMNQYCDL